ncbi:MAG: ATP-binding cassette domain-containing protein [Acetatifactor sp.]
MAEKTKKVLLEVRDLHVTFGRGRNLFEAVKGVNFQIYQGETFGLVGESGSGKTTIGRTIIRMYPASQGEIIFRGQTISGKISRDLDREVIHNIQMIFQDPMSALNDRAKVSDIVKEGLLNVQKGLSKQEIEERVEKALLDVGLLPEFASRFPHEFSGGQRQRIGIARALIMEPSFIIADEPISALDVSIRAQVLNLLAQLQKERGLTYLFIAHDLSVMRFISDRIAVIEHGKIVELAPTEKLFAHPLHPYTQALLSAIPTPNPDIEKKKKVLVYDESMHDYSVDKPEWIEIEPEHYILANQKEAEGYRRVLEQNQL